MLDHKSDTSAVICAFNEERTVAQVVRTTVDSGLFRDVVVICDGSTDASAGLAREAGATFVSAAPRKEGKGAAMIKGVAQVRTPYVFFIDADLVGLHREHLVALLEPVRRGQVDMAIGLRDRGWLITRIMRYLPLIGGERVLERKVFEAIPDAYLQGFMTELAINAYYRAHNLTLGVCPLWRLTMRRKMQKFGVWKGLKEYVSLVRQMIRIFVWTRWMMWQGKY